MPRHSRDYELTLIGIRLEDAEGPALKALAKARRLRDGKDSQLTAILADICESIQAALFRIDALLPADPPHYQFARMDLEPSVPAPGASGPIRPILPAPSGGTGRGKLHDWDQPSTPTVASEEESPT